MSTHKLTYSVRISFLSLSPLSTHCLWLGSMDCTIRAWNLRVWKHAYGECRMVYSGHTKPIIDVTTGPAGSTQKGDLYSIARDGTIR